MFRHLCAIFRERPLSLWVTWKAEYGCVVVMHCKCWWPVCTGCCSKTSGAHRPPTFSTTSGAHRPPTFTTTSGAHRPQTFTTTSGAHRPPTFTTTSGAHRPPTVSTTSGAHRPPTFTTSGAHSPPTFTVHDYNTNISAFQVTHKNKGRSLKMAHKCRNM
jgi:hypothetical protein